MQVYICVYVYLFVVCGCVYTEDKTGSFSVLFQQPKNRVSFLKLDSFKIRDDALGEFIRKE